jgi:beta-carotene 15,15'-dioxygenase
MSISSRLLYQSLLAVVIIVLNQLFPDFFLNSRYYILALIILLIGMPHGALDHIIAEKLDRWNGDTKQKIIFYSWYLALVGIYSVLWVFFPLFSFAFFMIITWYHFGQADAERFKLDGVWKHLLHFSRGFTVVGLIAYGDLEYASDVIESITNFSVANYSSEFIAPDTASYIIALVYPVVFVVVALIQRMKWIEFVAFFTDALVVPALFLFADPVWAFSIYFGLWHSYNHVRVMLAFLNDQHESYSFSTFYKNSFIYSLLSYIGLLFVYNITNAFGQEEYLVSLLFVVISVLTLPHMVVVQKLYRSSQT